MRIIGRYIAYLFCFMLLFVNGVNAQEYFNVRFDNPYLFIGSAGGLNVFYSQDTIFNLSLIVHSDSMGVGIINKLSPEGDFLDSIIIDSDIDSLNVNIGRFGGVYFDEEYFYINQAEFAGFVDTSDLDHLIKYNLDGEEIWRQPLGDTLPIITYQTRPAHDGGYLVCGLVANEESGTTQFGPHGLILKTDSQGHQLWEKQIEDVKFFEFLAPADDGDIFLGGMLDKNEPPDDFGDNQVVKLDSLGNEKWRMIFGGDGLQGHCPIHLISTDTILAVGTGGYNITPPNYEQDQFIFRIAKDEGNSYSLIDEATYPSNILNYHKWPTSLVEVGDGFVAAGSMRFDLEPNPFHQYGFLFKVNFELDSIWLRGYRHFFGQGNRHFIQDVDVTPDGGFVTTGLAGASFGDTIAGPADKIWIMRLDSMGCVEPGCHLIDGLTDIVTGLNNSMELFPNPANTFTTVRFNLPEQYIPQKSRLEIYDLQGRKVEVIPLAKFHNGFEQEIDLSKFNTGMYTVHWLSGGSWYDSIKLIKD